MSEQERLPDHPEEARLRIQETETAGVLDDCCREATAALRAHNRVEAAVLLSRLSLTADLTRKAMEKAIDDVMKQRARNAAG